MAYNSKIRPQKLSAFVLWRVLPLAIIAMGGIGLLILSITEKTVGETVHEQLVRQSEYVEERINQRLLTVQDEMNLLAQNDLIVNGLIDAESRDLYLPTFFASLRLGGSSSPRISLVDYKGKEIFHNGVPGGPLIDRADWVYELSAGEEIHYIGEDGMLVAVPVMVHGLPEGAMIASFSPESASEIFNTGASGIEIEAVAGENTVFHSSDKHGEHVIHNPDEWIEIRHAMSFFPGLEIVTLQHKDTAYSTIRQLRSFLIYAGLAVLAALVGAIVFSTYLSSRELGKLSSLLGGVTRLEHFKQRIKASGPEEVQTLGTAFNTMLKALEHTTTSKSYLDNILNSLNEILIVTTQGGDIVTLNLEAERFLAARNLGPDTNISTVIRADRYGVDQDPWSFLRVTGGLRALEAVYSNTGQSVKALLWTKSYVLDDDGLQTDVVYVASDITERMQMEQMKTEFVSTVSHELRTPLTSILGSIKLVQSGATGEISDKTENLLSIAHNNSERLVRLINDILDVQKIEAGQMNIDSKPLELCAHIANAVEQNDSYAKHYDVTYDVSCPGEETWIAADSHRLDQVLANLMSNAAKFSKAGSTVRLSVNNDGHNVTIAVSDTGVGIPEQFHDSIFEKFKQVDSSDSRSKSGTGLGLSITKDLMKLMNGAIWLDSIPGEGTTFYISFPALAGPSVAEEEHLIA